jgi:hypothetical protein
VSTATASSAQVVERTVRSLVHSASSTLPNPAGTAAVREPAMAIAQSSPSPPGSCHSAVPCARPARGALVR